MEGGETSWKRKEEDSEKGSTTVKLKGKDERVETVEVEMKGRRIWKKRKLHWKK